jgi:hypothetical protein
MRVASLVLSLLAAMPALAAETLTGRVLIQNAGPRTVLAFIETGDDGITHVLRLSAEEPFPQNPVSFQFDRAHVEIETEHFVITSAEQRMRVIFAVTPGAGHNATFLHGHWLSSKTIAAGPSIATIRRSPRLAALFCDACDDMGETGTSCTSGGPGAISCSCTIGTTGCTVTCGAGYYACCKDCYIVNGPICKCVKN